MSEAATANDLFISYAHIDNLPITEDERGWITEFHRILEGLPRLKRVLLRGGLRLARLLA